MRIIEHDLLPKQKSRKHNLNVEIDLYPLASELYDELDSLGMIERIQEIPQLGVIKVPKKLQKTRYDYVMLQLYIHQLIKLKLQSQLWLTYNNLVKAREFSGNFKYIAKSDTPSIGDILQLLTVIYNVGHFYNTFTASRAVTMMATLDNTFADMFINNFNEQRFRSVAHKLLDERNYQRIHLLNSILILERCNQGKASVMIAKELLYAYINEDVLNSDSKLHYIFEIFRKVRNVSYMAYDLQIAKTPFTIDLCDENAMVLLLRELLSEYNDNESSNRLVNSIGKLLDDTVYNENSNAICYYKISSRMVSQLKKKKTFTSVNFLNDFFLNQNSILNKSYSQNREYVQEHILKLTFQAIHRNIAENLLIDLNSTNNTRAGYYDRYSGELTILVSIKKNCDAKVTAALKVLRYTVSALRKIDGISPSDSRFLLCSKFFMYYFFKENPIVIKPTIDPKTCVLCTRGKSSRKSEIKKILKDNYGNDDKNHEATFMLNCLELDTNNDTSICVPASILVYQKDAVARKLCEFDGIIIHPMRRCEQILLLEAKNTSHNPSYGKKCLKEKLDKLFFEYDVNDIEVVEHDAKLQITV